MLKISASLLLLTQTITLPLLSKAEITLKVEPGCLGTLVARFKVKLAVLGPRPPLMAFTALMEKLGYSYNQAHNLLYSGGLQIITTQDPALQALEIYPWSNIYWSITFRLSSFSF